MYNDKDFYLIDFFGDNMNEGCLVCGCELEYMSNDAEMECVLCKRKELSKTCCVNGHYVCNDCHTKGLDVIMEVCLNETSINPIYILNKMMHMNFCHMHGPEHHTLVGASLLTAYHNAGGDIELKDTLIEMISRGSQVPGGTCGFWGACGAGISSGIFVSIISESTPLSVRGFKLSNKMTSESLSEISEHGGPRCCKRDSYLAILCAIDFVEENFGIILEISDVVCNFSDYNNQCLNEKCIFNKNASKNKMKS